MKRYRCEPYRAFNKEAILSGFAVFDKNTQGYLIEPNGMVWVSDRKAVRIWAKYLNDNLPYDGEGRTIENIVNSAPSVSR